MIMKKVYKLLLIAILPVFCLAQSNFKPGYVVTLKGDTLRGEVDYKEWGHNPAEVRFKSTTGISGIFTTANTNAFGITGADYYGRFIMPLSMGETDLSRLSVGYDSTAKIDTVFLKLLTKGRYLTLYEYTDNIKTRYLVADKNSSIPKELINIAYLDTAHTNQIITDEKYKNQLIIYAINNGNNSAGLINKIRKTRYTDDIIAIVNIINGDDAKKTVARHMGGWRLFAGVNVNYGLVDYDSELDLNQYYQQRSVLFPEITVGTDFFHNASIGKLVLRLELSYYTNTFTEYGVKESLTGPSGTVQRNLKQQAVTLSPTVFCNFYNTRPFKVFAGAGVAIRKYIYNYHSNIIVEEASTYYPELPGVSVLLPIYAGVTISNKFQLYFKYRLPEVISSGYEDNNGIANKWGAGIKYLFKIK